jgi:hypothetical protein
MNARRIAATLLPLPLFLIGAWLGGFDFDQRGAAAFWLFAGCVFYAGWQWFAPWWGGELT